MASQITCPNCSHTFEASDAFREEIQKDLREKAKEWQEKKEKEYNEKELAFQKKEQALQLQLTYKLQEQAAKTAQAFEEEKKLLAVEMKAAMAEKMKAEFENQLLLAKENEQTAQELLKAARNKEIALLKRESEMQQKQAEAEVQYQRRIQEERVLLQQQIEQNEKQKMALKEQEYDLRAAELKKQLEDQKKLIDEMKRKAEQSSMQLQGEVQELLLEEMLQVTFPIDKVAPVAKGVKGADCMQTVRNKFGQDIGNIIFESKRTKEFTADWIDKLKADMRSQGADVAVIVTQVLPKDMQGFGEKAGVYICSFSEVRSLVAVLRVGLLQLHEARKSQENKGDKMVMLYDYLTSSEFGEQWKAIREGFTSMKMTIQKERDTMEKLWKFREKQLEKVLLNAAHIKGSMEGIAGMDAVNFNLLEDDSNLLLE